MRGWEDDGNGDKVNTTQNFILETDSYKVGHDRLDAPGTTYKEYHFIPRGGPYEELVVFGLQMYLRKLATVRITKQMVDEAEELINGHLGPGAFNRAKWEHIISSHDGYLPVRIDALPEGTVVPPGIPVARVGNTCPKCAWLPGHMETGFTRNNWYPMCVATRSRKMRKILRKYNEMTSDGDPAFDFRLHDFGGRSYAGDHASYIGGVAHLAAGWLGTDTIDAVVAAKREYGKFPGAFSVTATEHSVRTTFGGPEKEREYLLHAVNTATPGSIVSIVGDTFNIYKFTQLVCDDLEVRSIIKEKSLTVVVRPDSGDPMVVVPQILEMLWGGWGGDINSKGYKVLNKHVRVIQGDGINEDTLEPIVQAVVKAGYALDNVVFGCGTGLMQKGLTRDTLKIAYKGNYAIVDGEGRDMWKDPVTDPGKKSIRGRFHVIKTDVGYRVVPYLGFNSEEQGDQLKTVFENGKLVREWTLDEVRARCAV